MRKRNLFHKKGQGLVEYALILALIAIVSIVALSLLGTTVSDVFSQITEALSGDGGGGDGQPPPGGTCYGSLLLPYLIGSTTLFFLIFRLGPQRSTAAMGV